MGDVSNVTTVAEGISNFGMMAVTAAFFLFLAGSLMVACFQWFKSIINSIIKDNKAAMEDLLEETKKQNEHLMDLTEGLKPETLLRIKNTSGVYFDYSVEKVCKLIKRVRKENHIIDKDATKNKIKTLVTNLHEDRNSRFDFYTWGGKRLTSYTNPEWIGWVSNVIEVEVYSENPNDDRAYSNVQAVYERIKLDFYHKLNA